RHCCFWSEKTLAECSKRRPSHPPSPGGHFTRPPRGCQDNLFALGRAVPRARPQRVKGRGGTNRTWCSRSPVQWILANGKPPQAFPISESLNRYVEGLNDARTPRAAPLPIGPRPPIGAPIRSPMYQYFNRPNSDHAEVCQHQQISLRTNALSTSSTP